MELQININGSKNFKITEECLKMLSNENLSFVLTQMFDASDKLISTTVSSTTIKESNTISTQTDQTVCVQNMSPITQKDTKYSEIRPDEVFNPVSHLVDQTPLNSDSDSDSDSGSDSESDQEEIKVSRQAFAKLLNGDKKVYKVGQKK